MKVRYAINWVFFTLSSDGMSIGIFSLLLLNSKKCTWQCFFSSDCGGFSCHCTSSSCFAFSFSLPGLSEVANWSKAVESCSHVGGAIASFHDKEEESALTFPSVGEGPFFGLERRPTAATGVYSFRWSDGSLLAYAKWNQLSCFNDEKSCGKLVYNTDLTIHWRPESCSSQHTFICKKPKSDTRSFSLYL